MIEINDLCFGFSMTNQASPIRANSTQASLIKAKHGRDRMYKVYRCRCPKCVVWKKLDNAKRFK